MTYSKVLFWNFPRQTEENHKTAEFGYLVIWLRFEIDNFQI